jgi:outer membrane protein TolC
MSLAKPFLAILLSCAIALPGFAQTPELRQPAQRPILSWFSHNYQAHPVPKVSFEDSPRIDKLMRAGNIYLSLRDAIALALENNLDIEYARFTPKLSEANLLRASGGQLLRNISSNITSGPSSASLGVLASTQLGSGYTSGGSSSGSGQGGVLSGLNVQLAGTSVPNLDPTLYVGGTFSHSTSIQTATNITGTNFLTTDYKGNTVYIQQGMITGTTATLYMNNYFHYKQNSPYAEFNPYNQSGLTFQLQQNLLQGFRRSVNNRYIRVARNQLRSSDLAFRNQVMTTVASVVSLYWDLVSFRESLKVKQQTVELDTKLYNDNKRRAELGAIAPIDIIQAEAEMKAAQQDVTTQESQVLQQETILKAYLTRGGIQRAELMNARLIPTDRFTIPEVEQIQPIQDLIAQAMANRPDIEQSRLSLENTRITTLGVKDALMPQLTATVRMTNNGVAGQVNTIPVPVTVNGVTTYYTRTPSDVNGYFLGGYGTVLSQLFGRNFPNYSATIELTMPIRNRSAQADLITDQLNYRQAQISDTQLHNNIRQNVINARIALSQARAAYETSVEARNLQQQTSNGTRRKYELGTATILDVVVTQRDLTTRELSEVTALNAYVKARLNLQNVMGDILKAYDVDIEQAKTGVVGREPDPIPAVLPQPAAANSSNSGASLILKR